MPLTRGMANSLQISACPLSKTFSTNSTVSLVMAGSSVFTRWAVNAPSSNRRTRVCSGGSDMIARPKTPPPSRSRISKNSSGNLRVLLGKALPDRKGNRVAQHRLQVVVAGDQIHVQFGS